MATLEKIRSKSVFLIVIIAVALLAFILGDAINNGRNLFGSGSTVAEVDGHKIDYTDYSRKYQELSQQLEMMRQQNPAQVANFDNQMLAQIAIEQLVNEQLTLEAAKKAGIVISPDMLRDFMFNNQPSPEMTQFLQAMNQSGIQVQSPEQAYQVITNPQSVGLSKQHVAQFERAWLQLEDVYLRQATMELYSSLLGGSFRANDLDIAAIKRDNTAKVDMKLAKQTYANVDEKKYPVSNDEIKKEYEKQKNRFAVKEPTKDVKFIAVSVAPSQNDLAAANKLADTAVSQLNASGQISKELRKEGLTVERHSMRAADVKNPGLKEFLASAADNSVKLLQSNQQGFQIAKMNGRTVEVDSIQISIVQVAGKALPAKVLAALQSGVAPDSLAGKFSPDSVMAAPLQWIPLYTAQGKTPVSSMGITDDTFNKLMNSTDYIVLNESPEGTVYAKVAKKSNPKEIYSYETVDYVLQPSENTLASERNKLQKFLANNKNAANFAANAKKAGYVVEEVSLTQSSQALPRGMQGFYPDSRSIVRWVMMDAEKGDVSKIYESKDMTSPMLYVAAVTDEYEDFIPWNNSEVKSQLTKQIRNSKAGDDMVKQYKGKGSLDQVAQAMGVEVQDVAEFKLGNPAVSDQKVMGRILGSKAGGKMQVVKGDDGVYAFVINQVGQMPNEQLTDENISRMYTQGMNPLKILRGSKKIKNNIYKFEQGE